MAVRLAAAIQEPIAAFLAESKAALADDAAGKAPRVVALEPLLQRLLLLMVQVVATSLADELQGGKVQNSHVCPCGGRRRYKVTRKRAWGSVVGELLLVRAYFRCPQCKATRYPLDVVWGLRPVEKPAQSRCYLTPAASWRLAAWAARMNYNLASKQFLLLGIRVSAMLAWQTVQRVGQALRAAEVTAAVTVAKGAAPGKDRETLRWLVSADGILVGFWKDARRRRRTKGAPGIRRRKGIVWKEVKVGIVALLNGEGHVVRNSQWYLVGLSTAKSFRQALWQVAQARGVRTKDVVAVVTDGAKWLRALVTRHFTWGIAIRDFYHASEHLRVLSEALYGEGARRARRWHRRMARRLKRGEIDKMLQEWGRMRTKPQDAKPWERERHYFDSQREAMAYAQFQEEHLPIGSGPMEAGCKIAVAERCKISGSRWTEEGFLNLSAVRVRCLNEQPLAPLPPSN